jgi:predicted nucleotidyltransferase
MGCIAASAGTGPDQDDTGMRGVGPSSALALENSSKPRHTTMMERDEAIRKLKEYEDELEKLGVQHLYLFDSTVRDEARADSDVDLFLDCERGKFSLFDLMDVRERASAIPGRNADVTTRDSLHKLLQSGIEASAPRIF